MRRKITQVSRLKDSKRKSHALNLVELHQEINAPGQPWREIHEGEFGLAIRRRQVAVCLAIEKESVELLPESVCKWIVTETNAEALCQWLETGGWDKLDPQAVESRLVRASQALKEKTMSFPPRGEVPMLAEVGAPFTAYYGIRMSDQDTPWAKAKIAEYEQSLVRMLSIRDFPEQDAFKPARFGLDALKADFANREMWGPVSALPSETPEPAINLGADGDWLILLVEAWIKERLADEKELACQTSLK